MRPRLSFQRHLPDQKADIGTSTWVAGHRHPVPEEPEREPMPADHRLRLDQNQAVLPAGPTAEDEGPEGSVPV